MKTIVSLALAGLMSISALLPALAAQEAENVSIPENSGISESVAQDESSVSSSGSTADESTAPESGSNAGADVSQPESDSMPCLLYTSPASQVLRSCRPVRCTSADSRTGPTRKNRSLRSGPLQTRAYPRHMPHCRPAA